MEIHFRGATVRIGRAEENEIRLRDRRLSRHHCRVFRDGDALVIEDLGSHNGTCLNGLYIHRPAMLRDGDVVELGSYRFEFRNDAFFGGLGDSAASDVERPLRRPTVGLLGA